jgi:hypothetical protein
LVEEDFGAGPVFYIRHHLIDFFAALGSGIGKQKDVREGNDPLFSFPSSGRNFGSMGVYTPKWMRAHFPNLDAVGRFEASTFDPGRWEPNYLPMPFRNRLLDDEFWAAKILMSLTDEDIRTVVKTGRYSDPEAEEWIANTLIERRDRVGRYYFSRLLPLDEFRVENGELTFTNLNVKYAFGDAEEYRIFWSTFDNFRQTSQQIPGALGPSVPEELKSAKADDYFVADILDPDADNLLRTQVFLRNGTNGPEVVGVERGWPDKVIATAAQREATPSETFYSKVTERQRELFDGYAAKYNRDTGLELTPSDFWRSMSISERTTFTAVTNALENTELTDEQGSSLGTALDRVSKVDRIAGQYYGRGGDEQFRVYFTVNADTHAILEASKEFFRDHDNTVYHAGYPTNFRQVGKPPTMQFSLSEDGLRADVDVDYRSSKMPKSMWNGHITSSNSDVRAGNNFQVHSTRWVGLIAWWQNLFGDLERRDSGVVSLLTVKVPPDPVDIPPDRPIGASPEKLTDAAQEFLSDWLSRGQIDQAVDFMSDQAFACVGKNKDLEANIQNLQDAKNALERVLREIHEQVREAENPSESIVGLEPWNKDVYTIIDHPYRQFFAAFTAPEERAKTFLCEPAPGLVSAVTEARNRAESGTYHAIMFRFRFGGDGGTIAFVWAKENARWKIVSWQVIAQ